ncbi:hypothetical protein G6F22_014964 [Rhizopus arrhizus]|nr:hypothetical protein G6F22_014964 [Rhizopus arrhizus]
MRKLQAELPALRTQAASVADLTAQARSLRQRSATPATAMPTSAELGASLERAGLPAGMWTLGQPESGAGVQLALNQAPSSALLRWRDGAGRDWGLATHKVDLTRAANPNGRPLPGLPADAATPDQQARGRPAAGQRRLCAGRRRQRAPCAVAAGAAAGAIAGGAGRRQRHRVAGQRLDRIGAQGVAARAAAAGAMAMALECDGAGNHSPLAARAAARPRRLEGPVAAGAVPAPGRPCGWAGPCRPARSPICAGAMPARH